MAGTDAGVLDILTCYSCGGKHDNIKLNAYSKPCDPWSHWYQCPENGDPVSISVEAKHGAPVERARKVMLDLDRATQAGKWLSAIFVVEGPKAEKVTLLWNAENFPHADYETCQRLFAQECAKHGGLPAPVEPLPRAQKFDASKLFPGLKPKAKLSDVRHEFDSSQTCNYCGIAAEKVQSLIDECPVRVAKIEQAEPGNGQ